MHVSHEGRSSLMKMILALVSSSFLFCYCDGSIGDEDPVFRFCVGQCMESGCINSSCFPVCEVPKNTSAYVKHWSLVPSWRIWNCPSECGYQCMVQREVVRHQEGQLPVQYHGKWPFKRLLGLQEPASVVFSFGNLAMHLIGWLSFLRLLYYELPPRSEERKSCYYEYTNLWVIYGLLSINAWIWSTIFHSRDVKFTERMDYLSAVAVIGFTLMVAIIRTLGVRIVAARVMVASPIIAFVTTHILYLNFYSFDYGLNMKICVAMGAIQLILWTIWGGVTCHPARFKLWFVVLAGASAMLLEVYDFPPVWGVFDAHSLWHAVTIPLTHYWWSFIKDDAIFRTSQKTNAIKELKGRKKAR